MGIFSCLYGMGWPIPPLIVIKMLLALWSAIELDHPHDDYGPRSISTPESMLLL